MNRLPANEKGAMQCPGAGGEGLGLLGSCQRAEQHNGSISRVQKGAEQPQDVTMKVSSAALRTKSESMRLTDAEPAQWSWQRSDAIMASLRNAIASALEQELQCGGEQQDAEAEQPAVQLPDALWLRVFSLLDARTLLVSVRPTCRRWSALALDPALWGSRSVELGRSTGSTPLPLLLAVCRAAPCLDSLTVDLSRYTWIDLWSALPQLASTACAVRHLTLHLHGPSVNYMMWTGRILQNQLARGRMRSLRLGMGLLGGGDTHPQLVQLLTGMERLADINLIIEDWVDSEVALSSSDFPYTTAPLPISRLSYSCASSATPVAVLRWLLAVSSGSLEHVALLNAAQLRSAPPAAPPPPLAELAECRNVRWARLPAEALQAIPPGSWGKLQHLTLDSCASSISAAPLAALLDFFRSATQLEVLVLGSVVENSEELAMSLVAHLASQTQPTPALRCLELCFHIRESWNVLAGALPGLPELKELIFCGTPPSHFVKSICPRSAPRLSRLELASGDKSADFRTHASSDLIELVQRHPEVHVFVRCGRKADRSLIKTVLCGHSKRQECDLSPLEEYGNWTLVRVPP